MAGVGEKDACVGGQHDNNAFLQLPTEIRLLVYRYTLVSNTSSRTQLRDLKAPSLLSVCQQIRREASPVFFSEGQFVLTVAIPPAIYEPDGSATPRTHRVPIPTWIQSLQQSRELDFRNVKVEIDYAFRWVVVAIAQRGSRLQIVEAWLHNGRQKLPIAQIRQRVTVLLDRTMEQKASVDNEIVGLDYRDVVLIAGEMCQQWAGSIVPA